MYIMILIRMMMMIAMVVGEEIQVSLLSPLNDVSLCTVEDASYDISIVFSESDKTVVGTANGVNVVVEFPKEYSYYSNISTSIIRVNGVQASYTVGQTINPIFTINGVKLGKLSADRIVIYQSRSIISPFTPGNFRYSVQVIVPNNSMMVRGYINRRGEAGRMLGRVGVMSKGIVCNTSDQQ